jgi:4-hydroxy-tetrahydrodipicolinate synthase
MDTTVFRGCVPALMTPCDADGTVDFDALVTHGKRMIDAGMSGVVYCGSMGDWPLLSDEQRRDGVERLVSAGIPVVVGTGAQSPARAVALAAHAADVGAAGLMVIPRVLSRGLSPAAQRTHFAGILAAAPDVPSVIYNSPYYGFETRADTQVVHGIVMCGARGVITGIGNIIPEQVLTLQRLATAAAAGDSVSHRYALELDAAMGPLSRFDEGTDLVLFYKHLMVLAGFPEYEHHVNPADRLTATQAAFATAQWERFQAWWDGWEGRGP